MMGVILDRSLSITEIRMVSMHGASCTKNFPAITGHMTSLALLSLFTVTTLLWALT